MPKIVVLNDVEVTDETAEEDGSVELSVEAVGLEGLLSAKLYFADQASADAFKNPN